MFEEWPNEQIFRTWEDLGIPDGYDGAPIVQFPPPPCECKERVVPNWV